MPVRHLTTLELEAGLATVRQSPRDEGVLELGVARPREGERQVLEDGELSLRDGLVGDSWRSRSSGRTSDGSPHPDMQLNVMNARMVALLAGPKSRWPLAGDQLFVDLDLSAESVPPGTRLAIGTAVIELTDQPHTGCGKFVERFGVDAMKLVNSELGRRLQLRGVHAKVVQPGRIRVGALTTKLYGQEKYEGRRSAVRTELPPSWRRTVVEADLSAVAAKSTHRAKAD